MKLRIAIAGTRGIPNHYGGFEAFAQELSRRLVLRGHEVYVYNSHTHPYQDKIWQGVHLVHCHDPEHLIGTAGQFVYDLNCIRHARKLRPDILLLLGYTSSSVWFPFYPGNTQVICNMDGMEWKRSKYNRIVRMFLQFAEKMAVNHSDALVADSPVIMDYLTNKYGKTSNYIPYGAEVNTHITTAGPDAFGILTHQYMMLVARFEKENNIEMILDGYIKSQSSQPFLVIGNTDTHYGKFLVKKYTHPGIRFTGGIYDRQLLESLVAHANMYFHGHSVGGTNPSLLEAMGTGVSLAIHDNPFNNQVVDGQAEQFKDSSDVSRIIKEGVDPALANERSVRNKNRIKRDFNWEKITDAYEQLFIARMSESIRQPGHTLTRIYQETDGIGSPTTHT